MYRETEPEKLRITSTALIAEARKWLGTPYRHQARGPHAFDCVGLVIRVIEDLHLVPDTFVRNYGRLPRPELIAQARALCTQIETPEPGCLVLIRWPREPLPAHAALCTGVNLIHSDRHHGRVVEHGYRKHWITWTDSLWRIPGVIGG